MIINYKWLIPAILLVSACNITKTYQQPAVGDAPLYRDRPLTDTLSMAVKPWQELFRDTVLQQYIYQGIAQNLDMKIALERITAARAAFRLSRQAFLPDINASASVKESRLSYPQGFGIFTANTQYDLGVMVAWEADIWGKLRSAKRAALAGLLQTEAARLAIRNQLVAAIATHYFSLLALDEQLVILRQTAVNRKADVTAMKELKASNIVNGAAVVQSEANQYAAEVAIPDVQQQIRETENALSILLALPPGDVRRTTFRAQVLPDSLQTGIPAALLQNRPDVMAAEQAFRVAFENSNVARTAFYPALTITGAGGFSSFSISDWFTSNGLFGNIMGGLTQPVFNKGANKARLTTALARQQEAFYNFQQVLLTAGKEVSDALYAYEAARQKTTGRMLQLQALEKAVDFTKELLRYSAATNYTDVLTSEQNLLAAQMAGVNDRLQQWHAVIALYRALGGK